MVLHLRLNSLGGRLPACLPARVPAHLPACSGVLEICPLLPSLPPIPPARSGKEAEVAQLQQVLEGFRQRVHALEVQNYSLALHLKQATDGKDALAQGGFPKNPDVF